MRRSDPGWGISVSTTGEFQRASSSVSYVRRRILQDVECPSRSPSQLITDIGSVTRTARARGVWGSPHPCQEVLRPPRPIPVESRTADPGVHQRCDPVHRRDYRWGDGVRKQARPWALGPGPWAVGLRSMTQQSRSQHCRRASLVHRPSSLPTPVLDSRRFHAKRPRTPWSCAGWLFLSVLPYVAVNGLRAWATAGSTVLPILLPAVEHPEFRTPIELITHPEAAVDATYVDAHDGNSGTGAPRGEELRSRPPNVTAPRLRSNT